MYTKSAKSQENEQNWHVVDAAGQPLGRLASKVASLLSGKHSVRYTPHVDTGDFVVVINASEVRLTGNKLEQKHHYTHSGTPGGFKAEPYERLLDRKPEFVIEKAVRGMLPKSKLGRKMASKLNVYAGPKHPHAAQKPQPFAL